MKRGRIVARKRFFNKYGKSILDGTLALAVVFCLVTFIGTNFTFTTKETAKAAEINTGVEVVEITSYSENQVVVEGGFRYFLEDAQTIIEDIQNDSVSNENLVYKAIIVNGKCTSILADMRE